MEEGSDSDTETVEKSENNHIEDLVISDEEEEESD